MNYELNLQLTDTKAVIDKHYYRIDVIEKVLANKKMTDEERWVLKSFSFSINSWLFCTREQLEAELDALKEILKRSEKELESLHHSNRGTTRLATLVFFTLLCIYCLYAVITNENWILWPDDSSIYSCFILFWRKWMKSISLICKSSWCLIKPPTYGYPKIIILEVENIFLKHPNVIKCDNNWYESCKKSQHKYIWRHTALSLKQENG